MKATTNRTTFNKYLKILKALAAPAGADASSFRDMLRIDAKGDVLTLSATSGMSFVVADLPAKVENEGTCHTSFKIMDVTRAAKDEDVLLSVEKTIGITCGAFKARIALLDPNKSLPIEVLMERMDQGVAGHVTLLTEDMINLCKMSKIFTPPTASYGFVEISGVAGQYLGGVQPSDLGSIDAFPMEGEGTDLYACINPDYLGVILSLCGNYTTLSVLAFDKHMYQITDPDDSTWFGLLLGIARENYATK